MDDIPPIYLIETAEQLRVVSDPLRVRIFEALSLRPMTVAQLSEQLGLAHAKVHYHVRELEQVGLVRLVETREKSGILEKYFRAVARDLGIDPSLLQRVPPDEGAAAIASFVQEITHSFMRTFARKLRADVRGDLPRDLTAAANATTLYLSGDEAVALERQIQALIAPYRTPRGGAGECPHSFLNLLYSESALSDEEDVASPAAPASPASPRPIAAPAGPAAPRAALNRAVVLGAVSYTRAMLEHMAARGERLDLYVLGSCTFSEDVPVALVDQVIGRFRLGGRLDATPEVRAVLQQKQRKED